MSVNQNKTEVRKQRIKQEELRRRYEKEESKAGKILLAIFSATALISLLILILSLATDAVYIHNTSLTENNGREVGVRGAAFLKALFTGNYSSSAAGYDDLAVPFYFYAQAWCAPAAIMALLETISVVATLALSSVSLFFAIRKKEYRLTVFSLAASVLSTVFAIALYIVCISMSSSQILPVYCSGNPACSVQSDMIWSVILSIVMLAANLFALIRYLRLKRVKATLA